MDKMIPSDAVTSLISSSSAESLRIEVVAPLMPLPPFTDRISEIKLWSEDRSAHTAWRYVSASRSAAAQRRCAEADAFPPCLCAGSAPPIPIPAPLTPPIPNGDNGTVDTTSGSVIPIVSIAAHWGTSSPATRLSAPEEATKSGHQADNRSLDIRRHPKLRGSARLLTAEGAYLGALARTSWAFLWHATHRRRTPRPHTAHTL